MNESSLGKREGTTCDQVQGRDIDDRAEPIDAASVDAKETPMILDRLAGLGLADPGAEIFLRGDHCRRIRHESDDSHGVTSAVLALRRPAS